MEIIGVIRKVDVIRVCLILIGVMRIFPIFYFCALALLILRLTFRVLFVFLLCVQLVRRIRSRY